MSIQNKVRLGFIGAGWWATSNHMPVFATRDDVELTAVCRLGQAELEQVKDHFGFAFATEDYRELLADCEIWIENGRGETTAPGQATISLTSP